MKKAVSVFLVLFIVLCCLPITCFAASDIQEVTVGAKYHNSEIEIYSITVDDGTADLSTQDDTSFHLDLNETYDGYKLVIRPITRKDKEAYDWFRGLVAKNTDDFKAYEIYLLSTQNEKLKLPDKTEIKITLGDYDYILNGISCEGEIFEIKSSIKNGLLEFVSTEKADYYLIQKREVSSEVSVEPSDNPIQTGDYADYYSWLILSFLALMIIGYCTKKHKGIFS